MHLQDIKAPGKQRQRENSNTEPRKQASSFPAVSSASLLPLPPTKPIFSDSRSHRLFHAIGAGLPPSLADLCFCSRAMCAGMAGGPQHQQQGGRTSVAELQVRRT